MPLYNFYEWIDCNKTDTYLREYSIFISMLIEKQVKNHGTSGCIFVPIKLQSTNLVVTDEITLDELRELISVRNFFRKKSGE